MNIIQIKNLSFKYKDDFVFYRLNFNIKKGEWVSVVGPSSCGKTTLMKLLTGLLFNDSEIIIDNIRLTKEKINLIRQKIGVVFEDVNNQLITETVRGELAFALENLKIKSTQINSRINDIAEKFNIVHLLDSDPHRLSGGEKQKVALASVLITNPKILILDQAFSMIDPIECEEILEQLKEIHQNKNLTIINLTHNLEETFLGDKIVVIHKGDILIQGKTKEMLLEDKVFNRIGIEIPFIVDFSIKLKLYGLIDSIILDMNKLVNVLWK